MTKDEEVIEGNRLIAEFMQLETRDETAVLYKRFLFDGEFHPDFNLKFHSSWDWLMPVVEKIEGLNFEFSISSQMSYENDDRELILYHDVCISDSGKEYVNITDLTKIEAVWLAVIQFIKWHNQNQYPPPQIVGMGVK